MKKLLGKEIDAFLKFDNDIISGILFDYEDDCVYIQNSIDGLVAIPKENIKYYATNSGTTNHSIENVERHTQSSIEVLVDSVLVANIPIPPTFDLSSFNNNIMRTTLGNPDVQAALTGKVQKSIEYFPGTVNIMTNSALNHEVQSDNSQQNSFVMSSSGSPISTFLNPSQMVGRLNSMKKKPVGDKNG